MYEIYCTSNRHPAERHATNGIKYSTIEEARQIVYYMFKNHFLTPDESADVLTPADNQQGFETVASWTWKDFGLTPVMG